MLRIGEFARLSQISIKMLRHYDALGILLPSHIDPESGYRFYEMAQLADAVRILALKDCGFSLEEIARFLHTQDNASIETLLQQRLVAQQQIVATEQARLQRLHARVEQLASAENVPRYDVALKRSEPLTLIGERQSVASTEEIGPFAQAVARHLFEVHHVVSNGPLIHLYFEEDSNDEALDLFVGTPAATLPYAHDGLCVMRLPGGELMACVIYQGDYINIQRAYAALDSWLSMSGYRVKGPAREIYHHSPVHTTDPEMYLTEIQYSIIADKAIP
ncbi:MerR family transcriptional regulator [Ktedonospora formicarum]|uniref:MerR family transcriptional regulator n=1 Tax=Ktedonospora formicarum TaxID=2778364 RepID=A0A8J3IDM6_9CHLR|nr:MerR family transcriptional regulator [Ktedonospora formicarum]GHO49404.1 MerR family transcriptional regulator [Ktedonospora formicarum]